MERDQDPWENYTIQLVLGIYKGLVPQIVCTQKNKSQASNSVLIFFVLLSSTTYQ